MPDVFHRSDEIALNYVDEGSGEAILFIHGVGASLDSWDNVILNLNPDRRYIRFDLRGHGLSKRIQGPYSLDDFVEDAIALLDYLAIGKFTLAGFSLGGLIAQAIALAHPHRLKGLALISTIAGRNPDEQSRVEERARLLATEGAEAHLSAAVDRWFTDEFRIANPEILEARRQRSLANDPTCYADAYQVLAGNDLGHQLNQVKTPTLVMTGECDAGSSPHMASFIHQCIDGSDLKILPRLKHAVLLEAPVTIAGHLEMFFTTQLNI